MNVTSRDRPKSAPYPRLKNNKKISKCLVFLLQYSKIENFSEKILSKKLHTQKNGPCGALKSHNAEKLKGGTPCGFSTSILSQNMKKLNKTKILFSGKISQCRKKLKGGPFEIFQHPFCRKTSKKCRGDPLGNFFFEQNVSQCRKK